MKNFKKVLALVLVVVMAMSFATMSTAAFTDAESITKAEAVDVLSAIGVINGYGDGSFKPEGDVTRAEMAKMIATILNKGEDVGAMYAGACTFADSVNHWAAGYIAYCAQEGIINGKNAATFDPDANVTGTEAAKMVLGALGHKADKAGLVGSTWASTTLSLAKKNALIGEDNNMTANMGQALNRENAAQLLFNGLKATMVEYTGGTNITIGNVVLNQGAEAKELERADDKGYLTEKNDKLVQLVEEYFPDLKLETGDVADLFGRTCNNWEFEKEPVGSYSVAPYITYTGEVTYAQLYTDLGKVAGDKLGDTDYHVDGEEKADKETALKSGLKSGETEKFIGGVGVKTEIFFDESNNDLNVVEINTYAGQIDTFVAAKKDANGDVTREAYVTVENIGGSALGFASATFADASTVASSFITDAFTAADAAADAIVYYTKGYDSTAKKSVLMSVAAATAVTGTNKGIAEVGGKVVEITVDSTTYPVNSAVTLTKPGTYDQDQTLYLDANGCVIYSDAVASNNYALVLDAGKETTFSDTVSAQLLFADGTVEIVKLAATHDDKVDAVKAMSIVTYYVDANGNYTLSDVATEYEASKVEATIPSLGTLNADANTIFVVGTKANDVTTYSVYTGISSVPGFTANTGKILYVKSASSANAGIVFCVDAKLATATTGNFGMLYVTGGEAVYSGANGVTYGNVPAVVDGQVTTIKVEGNYLKDTLFAKKGTVLLFEGGEFDATSGCYTKINFVDENDTYKRIGVIEAGKFTAYNAGIVGVSDSDSIYVEADTAVYVWNLQDKELQETTISNIAEDAVAEVAGYYTRTLNGATLGGVNAMYMVVNY